MPAAQTRLPGELAQELEQISSDFEADLMAFQQAAYETSDSEAEEVEPLRPLRNFPALGLITAMHSAIEVPPPADHPPSRRASQGVPGLCTHTSMCNLKRTLQPWVCLLLH